MTAEFLFGSNMSWTAAPSMLTSPDGDAPYDFAYIKLLDGRILVAGGPSLKGGYAAQIFDPASNVWAFTGPMNVARFQPAMSFLTKGRGETFLA